MQYQEPNILEDIIVVKPELGQTQKSMKDLILEANSEARSEDIPESVPLYNSQAIPFKNYVQLHVKRETRASLSISDIKEEAQLHKIISFFKEHPLVNLSNFRLAEKILCDYLNDPIQATDKLARLQEEFDKHTTANDKFGKLIITWALKNRGVRFKILRSKLKGCAQSIAISFKPRLEPALIVYTDWDWKNKQTELIRSKSSYKPEFNRNSSSVEFDAKVWQTFNTLGISQKNYMKSLDCIERNHLDLPKFVHEVNKKNLLNVMTENLMKNVAIKTDNQDTTFLNFVTNAAQQVEVKVTGFASSMLICW